LSTLDLSGGVFAVANMTEDGATIHTGYGTFDHSKLSGLNNLNLSELKPGDENNGDNTIGSNCFHSINTNAGWSTTPLEITDVSPSN
jgi:hypothetical protein